MTERLGDAPIEPKYHSLMNATARDLDKIFNGSTKGKDRQVGFILLVFPFGETDKGRCNYISNGADRKDVVAMLKYQIARFEGQPDIEGTA